MIGLEVSRPRSRVGLDDGEQLAVLRRFGVSVGLPENLLIHHRSGLADLVCLIPPAAIGVDVDRLLRVRVGGA
jgi:hypothetical protein